MTLGHWCGTWGSWLALSAAALVGCSGSTHEIGHESGDAGAGAEGGSLGGSGGKGAAAGKGGTGGKGAAAGRGGVGGTEGGTGAASGASMGATGGDIIAEGGAPDGSGGSGASGPEDPNVVGLQTTSVTKLDVLLMVDNSIGMADKQQLLAKGMQMLLGRFTSPSCIDADGVGTGVVGPDGQCASGTPEFPPVRDIHFGVITSSLGDHGSNDVCSDGQNQANGGTSTFDDKAQLIVSVRSGLGNQDFLSWAPDGDFVDFEDTASAHITAAGEHGCGYEASLESWYRFLVDPEPVKSMSNDQAVSVRGPVNDVVLAQRAAFLRPDSAVVIVMLTDENDCSIMDEDGQQGWLVGYKGGVSMLTWHMPRASSACSVSANDKCCRPCGGSAPAGCPDDQSDSSCAVGRVLPLSEDSMNLRCIQQVKRFGIDLLYPTGRYVEGLSNRFITPRFGGPQVQNPLFAPTPDGVSRDPGLVYFAGIVGVPWQDVVTDDTLSGGDFKYMTADELATNGRWDVMLGDPARGVAPTDPFMIESVDPRPTGTPHPLLANAAIAAYSSTSNVNPINGHEQAPLSQRDDLQFACIYQLAYPVSAADCGADADACDCNSDEFDKHSPLCEGTTPQADGKQVYGKAYPGLRELEVLRGFGTNSIVTSACPRNNNSSDPPIDPSYGYNSALITIAERASQSFGNKCLPRALNIDSEARTTAVILEARPSLDPCVCDATQGRLDPPTKIASHLAGVERRLEEMGRDPATECVCEIQQLAGSALQDCYTKASPPSGEYGFCYLDSDLDAGDPAFLASCPASQPWRIRFLGDGVPAANAATFLVYPEGTTP
jgi:hypothetical protein